MRAFCPVFEGWLGLDHEDHPFLHPTIFSSHQAKAPSRSPSRLALEGQSLVHFERIMTTAKPSPLNLALWHSTMEVKALALEESPMAHASPTIPACARTIVPVSPFILCISWLYLPTSRSNKPRCSLMS